MKIKVKAVYVSDLHIGSGYSNCNKFIQYLECFDFEELYLLGDIIDGYELKRKVNWTKCYAKFVNFIFSLAKNKPIVYVVGNHDDFLIEYCPLDVGRIKLREDYKIEREEYSVYLLHGDVVDKRIKISRRAYKLGSWLYQPILFINSLIPYFNFARFIKSNVKSCVSYISNYEESICQAAQKHGCSKVISGHIHSPKIKKIKNTTYYNCGDWVENCCGIIEDYDGNFSIVYHKDLNFEHILPSSKS